MQHTRPSQAAVSHSGSREHLVVLYSDQNIYFLTSVYLPDRAKSSQMGNLQQTLLSRTSWAGMHS